ncbi:hypothetical protein KUV61_04230 [Nocardioides marinus]|nr:hypothetical protein [Nocardioides marinus]
MNQIYLKQALTGISVVAALIAAFYWFRASRVPIQDFEESMIGSAFAPMQKASKLNAIAAAFAGFSALLQGVLMLLPE